MANKRDIVEENEKYEQKKRRSPTKHIRKRTITSITKSIEGGILEDDEFERMVKLSLGKSSLMIRKDRNGIAIQKG